MYLAQLQIQCRYNARYNDPRLSQVRLPRILSPATLSRLSSPATRVSDQMPINPDRARRAAAPSAAIVVRNEASDSDEEAIVAAQRTTTGGAPAAAVAVRAAAPQAVRDHALVTYMGEPYLAQSPDTCPSPDTIRYIVSGPSPDTIDTNLPCRIGIANRNVNVWGYIEGCMHVLWLCAASGQKLRGV